MPLNQWTRIEISQSQNSGVYTYTIKRDNIDVYRVTNIDVKSFSDVSVYAGDPWYAPAMASIRRLDVQAEGKLIYIL